MNTKTQPVASEPSSLNELAEVWSKAMTEYRELLARAGADAEKFRVENDMFGWNFHKGLKSGAIEMRLILCKVEKAIAALLSSDAKPASEPEGGPAGSGGWKSHAEAMEHERDYYRARAQTMYEHQRGEFWYWQGDGHDHLESMANSLPVVIRADDLRALIATSEPVAVPQGRHPVGGDRWGWMGEFNRGWNECRNAMLASSASDPQPKKRDKCNRSQTIGGDFVCDCKMGECPGQPSDDRASQLDAMLTKILNRRVAVEQELFDMAAGKKPMPDAAKLRELAMKLGDPAITP